LTSVFVGRSLEIMGTDDDLQHLVSAVEPRGQTVGFAWRPDAPDDDTMVPGQEAREVPALSAQSITGPGELGPSADGLPPGEDGCE
jgi:hypothetical protein